MAVTLDYQLKKNFHEMHDEARWSVLTIIMLHKNERNRCWPSIKTIAGLIGCSASTVCEAKEWFIEREALILVPYSERSGEEKLLPRRQHIYQLTGYFVNKLGERIRYLYGLDENSKVTDSVITDSVITDAVSKEVPYSQENHEESLNKVSGETVVHGESVSTKPVKTARTTKTAQPKKTSSFNAQNIPGVTQATESTHGTQSTQGDTENTYTPHPSDPEGLEALVNYIYQNVFTATERSKNWKLTRSMVNQMTRPQRISVYVGADYRSVNRLIDEAGNMIVEMSVLDIFNEEIPELRHRLLNKTTIIVKRGGPRTDIVKHIKASTDDASVKNGIAHFIRIGKIG